MITQRQKMQIKRQIASKHGLDANFVMLGHIETVKSNIVVDGGKILIQVPFLHIKTKHTGTEIFKFYPPDLRRMPIMVNGGI